MWNLFIRLYLLLILPSTSVVGQNWNACKFIEPNISISYDSNLFRISQRFSNTFYKTEAYAFIFQSDTSGRARIYLAANSTIFPSSYGFPKDTIEYLDKLKANANDSVEIVSIDTRDRKINDFIFRGAIAFDKMRGIYQTVIFGFHSSEEYRVEINYSSKSSEIIDDYDLLRQFVAGIRFYSKAVIEDEEELIRSKYSVQVQPTIVLDKNFDFRKKTFSGIVSVREPLEHIISEVRLNTSIGQEVFLPDSCNHVLIITFDSQKGNIVKNGELVLLNSFGKKVKLPFTFSYFNEGPN